MTERNAVYRCQICGNMVEVLHAGKGELTCCNQPMRLLHENTVESDLEKHLPVAQRSGEQLSVTVGSVPHPMDDQHYIEWIELLAGERVLRQHLRPGEMPSALFSTAEPSAMREYCNLHGLWRSEE